jgi:hypothetical protein
MKTTKLIQTAIKDNKLFFGTIEKTDGRKVKGGFKYDTLNLSGIFFKTENGDLYQVIATSIGQLESEFLYTAKKRLCVEHLVNCSKSKMDNYFKGKIYNETARLDKANRQKKDIEIIQSFLKTDCQKQITHLIDWTYGGEYNCKFKTVK